RELDNRATCIQTVARIVPACPADFGNRNVDLPVQFRAGHARAAQQVDPADGARRVRPVYAKRLSGDVVLQTAHHLGRDRGDARLLLSYARQATTWARA